MLNAAAAALRVRRKWTGFKRPVVNCTWNAILCVIVFWHQASFLVSLFLVLLWRCELEGCGCGRGCFAERCCAPQDGRTPLHFAVEGGHAGHAAVVEQLLAAGAYKDAMDKVSWGGGVHEECRVGRSQGA